MGPWALPGWRAFSILQRRLLMAAMACGRSADLARHQLEWASQKLTQRIRLSSGSGSDKSRTKESTFRPKTGVGQRVKVHFVTRMRKVAGRMDGSRHGPQPHSAER